MRKFILIAIFCSFMLTGCNKHSAMSLNPVSPQLLDHEPWRPTQSINEPVDYVSSKEEPTNLQIRIVVPDGNGGQTTAPIKLIPDTVPVAPEPIIME